jgi:hypothetical protein
MLGINHFIEFHVHVQELSSEDLDSGKCPLLPKITISSLLAELVCSYAGCARLMAEHKFLAHTNELVGDETSGFAFLIDNLLPSCQTVGNKDSPALVRT